MKVRKNHNIPANAVAQSIQASLALSWAFAQRALPKNINQLCNSRMMKETLTSILDGKIFSIPDYQRGYAWETKQLDDFVTDIDAMIDDNVHSHYTGTIVIYQKPEKPVVNYGSAKLQEVEVVDGQQRLTTCSIYLSIIFRKLSDYSSDDLSNNIATYLCSGSKTKLRLNNDTADFFSDLVSKGVSNIEANSVHQMRIQMAYNFMKDHVDQQLETRTNKLEYLEDLLDAITNRMNFSFYTIEVESEIGMTFELMNSRGKGLSSMELLKNYLMHWVYRNIQEEAEKKDVTFIVNKAWKEVYVNIAKCNGSEDRCLRIAWTLNVSASKEWHGYEGFKADNVIPLRNFHIRSKEDVKAFILRFADELALVSKHYSAIIEPDSKSSKEAELQLLTKIKNMANLANFLPLMVAARIQRDYNKVSNDDYLSLLEAIESFSYRVYLWERKRSNSGQAHFFRWADEAYSLKHPITSITEWIYNEINWFSPEDRFRRSLKEDFFYWFQNKRLLKYTLFEYELFLLAGKNPPKLKWNELSDSSIEHILPQNPRADSKWLLEWTEEDRQKYLHDIGNLVLTKNNASYSNFEFDRKKGSSAVVIPCYTTSNIKQERELAQYADWTVLDLLKRREKLTDWIIDTWGIDRNTQVVAPEELSEEELVIDDVD